MTELEYFHWFTLWQCTLLYFLRVIGTWTQFDLVAGLLLIQVFSLSCVKFQLGKEGLSGDSNQECFVLVLLKHCFKVIVLRRGADFYLLRSESVSTAKGLLYGLRSRNYILMAMLLKMVKFTRVFDIIKYVCGVLELLLKRVVVKSSCVII
jgi:hypothetical protein